MKKAAALGLLAMAAAFFARSVTFTADPTAHFPREDPEVAAWLALSQRFDAFNTLIVGLEEPDAPLAGLPNVRRITDRLTALKANGVLAVASVTHVESIHEGADGSLETELLVSGPDAALPAKIAADAQVTGVLVSRDQRAYSVVIRADPRRDANALATAIRAAVDAEKGALTATFFGAPFFQDAPTRILRAQWTWLVPGMLTLLLGVLAVTVRRPRTIGLAFGTAALASLLWLGLLAGAGVALSPSTAIAGLGAAVLGFLVATRGVPSSIPALLGTLAGGIAVRFLVPLHADFGAALAFAAAAVLIVGFLAVGPLPLAGPAQAPMGALLIALAGAGAAGSMARFHVMPQEIFGPDDDVGRALAFFDRRFGGPDFIQLDVRGDLRSPEVAARLLRLSDLLEGAFPDVRSVAPVLGFLAHGFGGVHRIPTTRDSLNNVWFFLEGRPDVRNLVSDARDEAMVLLRVPSAGPPADARARIDQAVKDSLDPSPKPRLAALAAVYRLPAERIDAVLAQAPPDVTEKVARGVQQWLESNESPVSPTPAQCAALAAALDSTELLNEAAKVFTDVEPARLIESIKARQVDLTLALHAQALAEALWPDAPAAARIRAQGIFADHLDPHAGTGASATVAVTGLPMVAPAVERDALLGLSLALTLLLGLGGAMMLTFTRSLRPVAEAALVAAAPLAIVAALGPGIDPGSAPVYLLAPAIAFMVHGGTRTSAEAALALSASTALLAASGALPIARIGVTLGVALAAAAAIGLFGRKRGA